MIDLAVHPHGEHVCVCPECNKEVTVEANVKCNEQKCPDCGVRMRAKDIGENRMADLATVDIADVEVLAVGTWNGSRTVTITGDDLKAILESFRELKEDSSLNYDVPLKLGHDDEQKMLQEDGYPSAGWVSSLKIVKDKLVADFTGIPSKIGQLIKAGGYKKISAELFSDKKAANQKVYSKVLSAISLLGADVPAVKSIQDMIAQYSEEEIMFEFSESNAHTPEGELEIKKQEVEQMSKEILEKLGLAEDSPIEAVAEAIRSLQEKANTPKAPENLSEMVALSDKVAGLETKLAEKNRDEAVSEAIRVGKISPAMKGWADGYALADPVGFAEYVGATSVIVNFSSIGHGDQGEVTELSEQEREMAVSLGLNPEDVAKSKKEVDNDSIISG